MHDFKYVGQVFTFLAFSVLSSWFLAFLLISPFGGLVFLFFVFVGLFVFRQLEFPWEANLRGGKIEFNLN